MDTFKYQQIDLKSSAFRLVRLVKADTHEDAVECELIHTTLDENVIPYEAVSYTWGTSLKECRIEVQGRYFMVTLNLQNLLRDLREVDTDRYLWIDAISINQDDHLERGHQIRRMQAIYSGAERVLCYVGETTESISFFMSSLTAFQRNASGYRWEPNDSRWKSVWDRAQLELPIPYHDVVIIQKRGLGELLKRPWFYRVWVLQEVANARKASLFCGRHSIPVQILATSIGLLDVNLNSHSRALLELMPTYSRRSLRRTGNGTLCQILVDFYQSEASEPRDKIFALLGLCADQRIWDAVVPDYTQTESALVHTTIAYIMTRGLGSPPEWLSSACFPPVIPFLDDLTNAMKYKLPINKRHLEGRISVNAHAVLDGPIAFEMMSLVLKYDNNLNNRPTATQMKNLGRERSLHVYMYGYLLNRLKTIMELSVRPPGDLTVLDRRKELYRVLSLVSGPYLNDVIEQQSSQIIEKTHEGYLKQTYFSLDDLEHTITARLTESDRCNVDGFEDWALFTMAVVYGRMWTGMGLLVKKPAGFDQCGMSDALALYSAIYFQHQLATGRLLDKGVQIVIGQLPNPLSLAVHNNNPAIMDVLRTHPANIVGYDGRPPLHCAVELETVPVIRFLLEQGADPEAVDRDGRTTLQVAKDSGRPGVARLLETIKDGIVDNLDVEEAEVITVMDSVASWAGDPINQSIDYRISVRNWVRRYLIN